MVRLEPIRTRQCRLTLHPARQINLLFDMPKPFNKRHLTAAITALWPQYHSKGAGDMAGAAIDDWLQRGAIQRVNETGLPRYVIRESV